jgi:hypothetical protein
MRAWQAKGIVRPEGDGAFRPDDPVTSVEAADLLTAAWSVWTPAPEAGLADDDGARLTREAAALALYDIFRSSLEEVRKTDFTDFDQVSPAAADAVAVLAGNGVIAGYPDGRVGPDRAVTRAEFIAMTDRLLRLAGQKGATVLVQDTENTAAAHISEAEPDTGATDAQDMGTVAIGRGADGARRALLLRFPLPAGILAAEVTSARVYVHYRSGDTPALQVSAVTGSWSTATATWNETAPYLSEANQSPVSEDGGAGWYTIDVTALVKGWLSEDLNNNGLVIEETQSGHQAVFDSAFSWEEGYCPKLEIVYTPGAETERYGKYAFERQATGNCMSFALRDRDMILYDDLFDTPAFQAAYDAGGTAAAFTYVRARVLAYVEEHKESLRVEAIRPLDGFDGAIDPETEYRVALRVGFRDRSFPEGIQVDEDFDYHFWAQLADGSWAEKTPQEAARRVPGANAATDPGAYPWHQGYMWGYEKWNDYYTSDVAYFAVTKTADNFTGSN